MLESLFNKVTGPEACIMIKKRLQHRYSVKIVKYLKTVFYRIPPVATSAYNKIQNL